MTTPTRQVQNSYDCIVIGGALVGASVAYGLGKAGLKVAVLDGDDSAFRASRGNFGLVWVQNKGAGCPDYARLSLRASRLWSDYAEELRAISGVDPAYQRSGGLTICVTADELEFYRSLNARIEHEVGGPHVPAEFLDGKALRELMPAAAADLPGALYSPVDGICNPLALLRALHEAFRRVGVTYLGHHNVNRVFCRAPGEFIVETGGSQRCLTAGKVVFAAGLGNTRLVAEVGLEAPLTPLHGQIVVTERVGPFPCVPNGMLRPTAEGSLLIAHSEANVGFDTRVMAPAACAMVARCLRAFPGLRHIRVVRTWAALRVMTPDGLPIYDQSESCPGAFLVTCHSGVTLAPFHAGEIAGWIASGVRPEACRAFTADRFHV
ncbi:MAG: FAD-binding oxidoreductase [Gammaproteobacteria bacterium]|nr:MAG: FAD-binding oxidoreductase [Gammaproteobacteria bacterium]